MYFLSVLVLILVSYIKKYESQTLCSDQLFNYYTALGTLSPQLPVITFTTGTVGGLPFVTATLQFELVAQIYQSSINASIPYVSYVSFDNPWCASSITITCAQDPQYAPAKLCSNIIDYDLGSPNPVAGRFYVYVRHDSNPPQCNGTGINITFVNTTLTGDFTANYVYDAFGITSYTLLNQSQAINQYRLSDCDYFDGSNITQVVLQKQFACVDQVIGCIGNRTQSPMQNPVVPVPRFSCFNQTIVNQTDNSTIQPEFVVWFVNSFQPLGATQGNFRQDIVDQATLSLFYAHLFDPFGTNCLGYNSATDPGILDGSGIPTSPCFQYILLPSTRREIQSNNSDFCSVMLLNTGTGNSTNWHTVVQQATFPSTNDPIISITPCFCNFNADCDDNGNLDLTNLNHFINPHNQKPIARTSNLDGNSVIVPRGVTSYTLNATASFDPDDSPKPLSFLWSPYNRTNFSACPFNYGTPLIDINDPRNPVNVVNLTGLPEGVYFFVLYVSDGQDVTYTIFNLTISDPVIAASCPLDFQVPLIPCNANTSTPSTCIPLNGSASFSTDPNITIFYNWTQQIGWNLWPPVFDSTCGDFISGLFNYTQAIACFIPPFVGLYQFNLTVTDNVSTTSSCIVYVNVIPPPINHTAPNETIGPFNPTPLRTDPPINRTIVSFPPSTLTPITTSPTSDTAAPTTNTNVTPNFPIFPPATNVEWLAIFAMIFAGLFIFILYSGILLATKHEDDYNFLDRIRTFYW